MVVLVVDGERQPTRGAPRAGPVFGRRAIRYRAEQFPEAQAQFRVGRGQAEERAAGHRQCIVGIGLQQRDHLTGGIPEAKFIEEIRAGLGEGDDHAGIPVFLERGGDVGVYAGHRR